MIGAGYLRSLAKLWKHSQVGELEVRVNRRFTAVVGRCVSARRLIEISPVVASRSSKVQREVLCHEAAHLVVWGRYGRSARPHGPEWRGLVQEAGFDARATLVRCGEARRRAGHVTYFRHACAVCHFSKRARRRMPRWRCPECRAIGLSGTLLIEPILD